MEAASLQLRAPTLRWNWRISPLQLALLLAALALGVRAIGLGARPLWLDEGYSAWYSARGWHELWTVVPTYEAHPPFYYSLLKLWRSLFGGEPVGLRSLSVLFAVLTIPLVIAIAFEQERQDPTGRPLLRAGVAAFLMACSPMLVMLGEEARPYPLLIFAFAVAVLGLFRLKREFATGGAGDWRSWAMLAAGTELVLWAHAIGLFYALCLAAALIPFWLKLPSPARIARGVAAAAAIALLYLPCLIIILNHTGEWSHGWLTWHPWMLFLLAGLYAVPIEALTIGSAVAALILFLLIKRALQYAITRPGWNSDRATVLLWLGPPLLAVLVSMLFFPLFLLRTLAPTLVAAYLAIGAAVARTPSFRERFALTAALIITLVPTAIQVALRAPSERWDEVNAYLISRVGPADQVWLYPNDSVLPLEAAAKSATLRYPVRSLPAPFPAIGVKGVLRVGQPEVPSLTRAQANAVANDPKLKRIPIIWLVTRQAALFDPDNDLGSALARTRRAGPVQQWGFIHVQPYYATPN